MHGKGDSCKHIFDLSVSVFEKIALLDSTSLRKFKIYQPEEQQVWNISPLMEVCFLLSPVTMVMLRNTRQVP